MFYLSRPQFRRYGLSVIFVASALLLMLMLDPWLTMTRTPFLLFFGAVLISAFYGGTRAGLLATFLSTIVSNYFFLHPLNSLEIDGSSFFRLLLFAIQGIAVSSLCGVLRKTNQELNLSLKLSGERYGRIVDTSNEGIWAIDAFARIEYVNQRLVEMFGYSQEEMLHRSIFDFMDESVVPIAKEHIEKRKKGIREQFDFCYRRKDGSPLWAILSTNPIFDRESKFVGSLAMLTDITERKIAREALQESEERLRLAVEGADLGMWDYNLRSGELIWSHRCKALFGLSSDREITYEIFLFLLHPEDREKIDLAVKQAITNQQDYDVEMRTWRSDGRVRWVRAIGRAYYNNNGEPIRMAGVVIDINDRKQAEQALKLSESRFANLAANLPGVIYQFRQSPDGKNGFTYISSGCFDLYEIDSEEILQNPSLATEAIHPDDLEAFQQSFSPEVSSGEQWRHEWRIRTPSGKIKWIQGIARSETHPDGFILWDGLLLDISDRKRADRERENLLFCEQSARETAEAANRLKDEFLAVLSHELRTPLNPILGWIRILQTRKCDEQTTNKALETIERNARLQTQLIDDLLDVSRILQGKMLLSVSPVNLESIIQAAVETVRLAAEAKGIQIQTIFNLKELTVLGDSGRLQQLVWNLLSNAVKFTPNGGRIEVQLEHLKEESYLQAKLGEEVNAEKARSPIQFAQIRVGDTGIGIETESLLQIFDYFYQVDSGISRKFGGLGLGLAIVRHIAELHGGKVTATSPGKGWGSTFTVTLPLMESVSRTDEDSCQNEVFINLNNIKVLVVDDEADTRELITFVLKQFGAKVMQTASAIEAMQIVKQFKPNIAISDIGMPEMDGYTFMRQIRNLSSEEGGKVLAIALTAYARDDDKNKAIAAGFQMHLGKPIDPPELIKAVAKLLQMR